MIKEVVIEGEAVDVILQGGRTKGNINNRDNKEERLKNMVVVVYNLIKYHHSSMAEKVTTKDSRSHTQMWKDTTIGITAKHTDLM